MAENEHGSQNVQTRLVKHDQNLLRMPLLLRSCGVTINSYIRRYSNCGPKYMGFKTNKKKTKFETHHHLTFVPFTCRNTHLAFHTLLSSSGIWDVDTGNFGSIRLLKAFSISDTAWELGSWRVGARVSLTVSKLMTRFFGRRVGGDFFGCVFGCHSVFFWGILLGWIKWLCILSSFNILNHLFGARFSLELIQEGHRKQELAEFVLYGVSSGFFVWAQLFTLSTRRGTPWIFEESRWIVKIEIVIFEWIMTDNHNYIYRTVVHSKIIVIKWYYDIICSFAIPQPYYT